MRDPRRVAILISGRGSNMRALAENPTAYEVILIASNRPSAAGLEWARQQGLNTWSMESKGIGREVFDRELSAALEQQQVGTIALAGFMRILSPWFIDQWRGRIVNIHPSLLPKYRGLDTHERAIEAGETVAGCSVHLVTEELDAGQVLGMAEVSIEPNDTPTKLAERVLAAEHSLYPKILSQFVSR